MNRLVAILLLGVAVAGAQQFTCPHDFGYYPHDVACDKYWSCENLVPTLKTCGNGLAFDDADPDFIRENCDYYHNIDCSTRPERQPAISSPNCPYQYGIFADPEDCAVFWSCWGGDASRYQCGPGLAYSLEDRICTWADKVPTCDQQRAALNELFACPAAGALVATSSFSRHAHPEDCREFYVCLDGIPREYGCPIGTVFKIGEVDGTGECAEPETVPGCELYYGELDLTALRKSQLLLGNIGLGTSEPLTIPKTSTNQRPARPQSDVQQKVRPQNARQSQSTVQAQEVVLDDHPLN